MQCKGILTRAGRNAVNKLPGSGSYIITATISGTTLAPTHSISPGFGGRRGRRDHSPDLSSQNQPRTHHLQTTMIRKRLAGHSLPAQPQKRPFDALRQQLTLALSLVACYVPSLHTTLSIVERAHTRTHYTQACFAHKHQHATKRSCPGLSQQPSFFSVVSLQSTTE